jgi:type VI secretion system secreted protein VgrG
MPHAFFTSTEIHQRVTARLRLPGVAGVPIPGLDSYSVYRLEGASAVSQSYRFTLRFASDRPIDVEAIVDTEAELTLKDEQRPLISKTVHGRIYSAKEHGSVARKHLYEIGLVSPLHYLSLNRRYEIYMDKSVPEIVSEVIGRYDALLHLSLVNKTDAARFPKRHYTTQYEQSDFEFLTMLCEEEGLVLLIDAADNAPYTLTLCELNEHSPVMHEGIECRYNLRKHFAASAEVQDYYDPRKPSVEMQLQSGSAMSAGVMEDNASTRELRSEIRRYRLRDRLEELEGSRYKDLNRYTALNAQRDFASGMRITGEAETLTLQEGITVTLEDEKAGKSTDAIILSASYYGFFPNALDEYLDNEEKEEAQYRVTFEAIPRELIYRPQPTIVKPRIEGIVTAIVSGGDQDTPSHANEIDVNEQSEIRVIFHFDEKRPTSCYIPLSTLYAGDGYGAQFLPRINSEVIVSFIGGDPDRPVITGALHNGENRHPYNLPKEKTQSFIKTQTTPQYEDTEGYNELRFEDRQGEERLSLRAQKDYSLHVLNDAETHIEHDSKTVIDHDMEQTVQNDRTETVGNDYRLNVTANRITTVEKEQLTTVKEDRETHLLKDDTTIVNENRMTIVEQNLTDQIKGEALRYTEKDERRRFLENLYQRTAKAMGIDVKGAFYLEANSIKQTAASKIDFKGASGISFKCGGNVLTVDGSGIHFKTPNFDANSGNGGVSAAEVPIKGSDYNVQFSFVDDDGEPIAEAPYLFVYESGDSVEGITDVEGKTTAYYSKSPEQCAVHLLTSEDA